MPKSLRSSRPAKLVIEHSEFPSIVTNQKGELTTPKFQTVSEEFDKIPDHKDFALLIDASGDTAIGLFRRRGFAFCKLLGCESLTDSAQQLHFGDRRQSASQWIAQRQQRTVGNWKPCAIVGSQVRRSPRSESFCITAFPEFNDSRWTTERRHQTADPTDFIEATKSFESNSERKPLDNSMRIRVPRMLEREKSWKPIPGRRMTWFWMFTTGCSHGDCW